MGWRDGRGLVDERLLNRAIPLNRPCRRRRRYRAELSLQPFDLEIRIRLELTPHQRFVLPRERQRVGAITADGERLEVADRETAAQRVADGQLAPPFDRAIVIPGMQRFGCERYDRRNSRG